MSAALPKRVQRVVVVTSAPHTSQPAVLSPQLTPRCNATGICGASPIHSAELSAPSWIEYLKLLVYCVVAKAWEVTPKLKTYPKTISRVGVS